MGIEMNELSEIKALVQHQIQASEARHIEGVKDRVAMKGQLTELRHAQTATQQTLTGVGTKVLELDKRLAVNEEQVRNAHEGVRKAQDSNADLEGKVLAAVGTLSSNDKDQNLALAGIRKEIGETTLAVDALVKSETERSTREATIYWVLTKGLPMAWVATFAIGSVVVWVATHWK